jgi:alpha-L-rhamnosidase
MGWLNDMAARTEEALLNFDLSRLFPKWIADIADAQDPFSGAITDTAPYHWGRRPADPVSVCYLMVPWMLYLHYGDRRVLADHYRGMKGWVDYLRGRAEDGIVNYSYYGDWAPPVGEGVTGAAGPTDVSRNTPGSLMSTGFFYYATRLLAQIAEVVGEQAGAAGYGDLARRIAAAYNQRFWDETQGGYGSNNQACNAFSLYLGLVPDERKPRVVANLVRDVVELHGGHLTTGNLCTKYLLEALVAAGRADVAYQVASQETYPSWGYMLANGATTLWERWEHMTGGGMNSHNHPMLGSVGAWLYRVPGGITLDPEGPGFARFNVRPWIAGDLSAARAALKTVRGRVESAWQRTADGLSLRVVVPVGSQARVSVPKPAGRGACQIFESGQPVWQNHALVANTPGIATALEEDQFVTFVVGSGEYTFVCHVA